MGSFGPPRADDLTGGLVEPSLDFARDQHFELPVSEIRS